MTSSALILFLSVSISAQTAQEEFLDPMQLPIPNALDVDRIAYEDEELPKNIIREQEEMVRTESGELIIQGFRVQLISTQDVAQAESVEVRAIGLFETDVYLVFEYPNYKVRVGNFLTLQDGRSTEIKARRNGFPRAWTVPSEVRIRNLNEN